MEKLTLKEIAEALDGSYNNDCEINGVCIDTRKITEGCLFICIKGERFDAHQFAAEALEKGAAAVMIHNEPDFEGNYVKVSDTSKALLDLGGYYRSKFDIPLVGLTGSVGKTTTKEFTYLVVSAKYNAIKTLGNLNNEIGLPRMLLSIDSKTEAAVIEMGMNHFGEIHRLTLAAKPTVGLITNIGVSHIENLGSREGILKAKLELLDGLKKGAPLILNGDNDLLKTVKNDDYDVRFYSVEDKSCDFVANNISENDGATEFEISFFGKTQKVRIPTIGIHNVYNALSAFAVGYYLDIEPGLCAKALGEYVPEGMRQKTVKLGGITCIEDCYNASPDSMRAAINTLANTQGKRKIAVLSDMLELGDYSDRAHAEVGRLVGENGIDYLFCCGEASKHMAKACEEYKTKVYYFENKKALTEKLIGEIRDGDAVIFKASRGMKLEEVIHSLYDRWEKK